MSLGVKIKKKYLKKEKKPWKHTYVCPRVQRKKKKAKQPWKHMYASPRGAKRETKQNKKNKKNPGNTHACPGVQRKKKREKKRKQTLETHIHMSQGCKMGGTHGGGSWVVETCGGVMGRGQVVKTHDGGWWVVEMGGGRSWVVETSGWGLKCMWAVKTRGRESQVSWVVKECMVGLKMHGWWVVGGGNEWVGVQRGRWGVVVVIIGLVEVLVVAVSLVNT